MVGLSWAGRCRIAMIRACWILVLVASSSLVVGAEGAPGSRWDTVPVMRADLEACPALAVGQVYRFHAGDPEAGGVAADRDVASARALVAWYLDETGSIEVLGRIEGDLLVAVVAPSEEVGDVLIYAAWEDSAGRPRNGYCHTTAVAARVRMVAFGGDGRVDVAADCSVPPCPVFSGPAWEDTPSESTLGSNGWGEPVAYLAGSTIVIDDIVFDVWPQDIAGSAWVAGTGPGGLTFSAPARLDAGIGWPVHGRIAANDPLPSAVGVFEPFTIHWTLELPSGTDLDAGATRNPLYVTLARPLGDRLESYFAIGARAAAGLAQEGEVVDAIWADFASLHVANAAGDFLGYYRGTVCAADLDVYDAPGLVVRQNGQCGAWQDLFIQVLRTQGIAGALPVTVEAQVDEGFLVKNYRFGGDSGAASQCDGYPWEVADPCTESAKPSAVQDMEGVPGQDESDPASLFSRHFIVRFDGKYYDPSYGVGPIEGTRLEAAAVWESVSIAGYLGECDGMLVAREDVPGRLEVDFDR